MIRNKTINPDEITAIVDTREQNPLDLSPLRTIQSTLDTGDYSLLGLEHVIRIERKSLFDLISCVGRERERFDREVQRLLAYSVRVLLVESTWGEIESGDWHGKVKPSHVIGSLMGWIAAGLQIDLVGDHLRAGRHASRLLFTIARRRYRELCSFENAQKAALQIDKYR